MASHRAEEKARDNPQTYDRLALLYQGFLIAVVRVQTKREKITDAANFRRRMKTALDDVDRAARAHYSSEDIKDAHLAVLAFLDEVIIGSDDPLRAEWKNLPMAQEILHEDRAGDVFVEKLESLLQAGKDSLQVADLLEIYLLCLMLGFEGQYSGNTDANKHSAMERARWKIETIRRQRGKLLSPEGKIPETSEEAAPRTTPANAPLKLTLAAAVAGMGMLLLFIIFKLDLYRAGNAVLQVLTQ